MCGIAGVFQEPARQTVEKMIGNISHRGPDGNGILGVPNGTLGRTRLAILDVEGGHQPRMYHGISIVFNGEIYNYRELKREYLPNLSVKTRSDTEVLLHLYRKLGPEFVKLLDGMFTFAIEHMGETFLARDRLEKDRNYTLQNKEALYYYRTLREFYDDKWILPTMGNSRSL